MVTLSLSDDKLEHVIESVVEGLKEERFNQVSTLLAPLRPGEIAHVIHYLSAGDRQQLVTHAWSGIEAEVLTFLDPTVLKELSAFIKPELLATAIKELESDDVFSLIDGLPQDRQAGVLAALGKQERERFKAVQSYPENSAARVMQQEVVAIPHHWTVKEAQTYLKTHVTNGQTFYNIFLIDKNWTLLGVIPVSKMFVATQEDRLIDLADQDAQTIGASNDQEEIALHFKRYALISAPVISDKGKLLGVITADDILNVLDKEAEEDIMHLGGVGASDFYAPVLQTTFSRFQWLLITFFNTLLASAVLSQFQMVLEKKVALAILMPIVGAMGGNAGTQVVTVVVRALATQELSTLNMGRTLFKASIVSLLNGFIFALILSLVTAIWFQDFWLAVTLGSALLINMVWAGIGGTLLPIIVDHMGLDPALSAGPLLTTTTDVLGFAIFLGLAKVILF